MQEVPKQQDEAGRGKKGAANAHMSAKSGAADMARDRVAAIARVGRVLHAVCPQPSTTRIHRRACTTARTNRRQARRHHASQQSRQESASGRRMQGRLDQASLLRGARMQGLGQIRPLARATRMRCFHLQVSAAPTSYNGLTVHESRVAPKLLY